MQLNLEINYIIYFLIKFKILMKSERKRLTKKI